MGKCCLTCYDMYCSTGGQPNLQVVVVLLDSASNRHNNTNHQSLKIGRDLVLLVQPMVTL